ncbi:DUF1694 domain-containing protein [Psychrilyobacter sp.]|uniref:DUF1694 domain-containing protein n=1 Tax=Psychrilyobacter sp. TaxID=2586924 RepID=UPI00301A1A52
MKEMNHLDLLDEKEKKMNQLYSIQHEKKYYLDEYRERIIIALKIDQLVEDEVYLDIIEAIKSDCAKLLKLRRDVGLKYLKPYIKEAEKLDFRYELVDGLSYLGDIGLVVVSDKALDNENKELVVRDMNQDFLDVGLGHEFSRNQNKSICNECYLKIEDKLPSYLDKFKRLNIIDKLLGTNCPVCRDRKKSGGNE